MSSKKEIERREKITSTSQSSSADLNITTEPTINTRTTTEVPLHEQQREQHHAINRALDETKENIRKSTEEARTEIPRYTQAVNEYQEQTIQASREIADNYIESQKQIINSLQSAWVPQIEEANRMFTSNWMSPRHLTEIYANMVSSFADNMIAATRLVNNMMFASMDAFKTSVQQSKDNAKELSRIGVNNARTFEQTSRDSAARLGRDDPRTSTKVYVEREQEEQGQRRY
jgi:predicted component of type VI protein secretion system